MCIDTALLIVLLPNTQPRKVYLQIFTVSRAVTAYHVSNVSQVTMGAIDEFA